MNKKKKIIIIAVVAALVVLAVAGGILLYGNSRHVKVFKATGSEWNTVEVTWKASKEDIKAAIVYSSSKFEASDADKALSNPDESKTLTVKEGINLKNGKCKIEGLHPDTEYYVTIAEKDKNGYHKALEPVVVHTGELSELGDILKIDKTSADSVTLSWDSCGLSDNSAKNGDISITYSIQVSSFDKDNNVKDVKETVYTVTGLTPLTKYTFKLTATVTIGDKTFETKPSKAVEVITLPSAITGLTASAKDGNSISVKWDKLKDTLSDGAKVTYQLYGSDKKDGEYTALSDSLSETAYTETKLKTGTTRFYYVTVTVAFGENEKVVSEKCETVSAKAEIKQSAGNSADRNTVNKNNNQNTYTPTKKYKNQPGNATPELNAQARVIAQKIANEIKADASLDTDLKKVTRAAQRVAEYASKCRYTMEGDYYASAYGVFIKGEYSCAGTARALGMVLECMGYSWQHVNENGYTHQWVELTMDGQHGWADGFPTLGGAAGYGKYPFA